ncbi:glutaredoxin 3 [Sansalvadorimonas verongulae]|uniref:glutaredoxin 3 n=1 Tax=Sansalvadorimonas verongulae TaxID=2172824 RepID=UPI0012BC7D43|nr:glutaredoxin 3 [Sansalvadorimonas verongulae]MTI15019.1 glutaredoxin 3 [Sansalvadorimonas verongulae]
MQEVVVFSSALCPFCQQALGLLKEKGVPAKIFSVDGKPDVRKLMTERSGRTSVPQIWIGKTHVGGCDDLYALEARGELDSLLAG